MIYLVGLLVAAQTAIPPALKPQEMVPTFSLTISLFQPGTAEPGQPIFRKIQVDETNVSKEPFTEHGCMEFQGVFHISVSYNGLALHEKDAAARKRREADAKKEPCRVMDTKINPGQSWTRYPPFSVDYPLCKPGTYEVTVSRESDPEHPEGSVTVKSNTLTIVVEYQACNV
jgi:hypothetical protein